MAAGQSQIRCSVCGVALTGPLLPAPTTMALNENDGEDYVTSGYFIISDGYYTGTEGQFIVNLHDVTNTQRHADSRRLNGCCGLDGLDGKNIVCVNGHEVGTERSDCWLPHAVHFDPTGVRQEEVRA